METPNSAVVVASSGALQISTEHDGSTVLLPEGSAARVSLVPADQQGGPPAAGRAGVAHISGKLLAIIVILVGGGLLAGGIIAGRHEHKKSQQELQNEVSPFRL